MIMWTQNMARLEARENKIMFTPPTRKPSTSTCLGPFTSTHWPMKKLSTAPTMAPMELKVASRLESQPYLATKPGMTVLENTTNTNARNM